MSYLKNQGIVGLLGGGYEMANFLIWQSPTIHPISNQLLRLIVKMPADEIQSTYSLNTQYRDLQKEMSEICSMGHPRQVRNESIHGGDAI